MKKPLKYKTFDEFVAKDKGDMELYRELQEKDEKPLINELTGTGSNIREKLYDVFFANRMYLLKPRLRKMIEKGQIEPEWVENLAIIGLSVLDIPGFINQQFDWGPKHGEGPTDVRGKLNPTY